MKHLLWMLLAALVVMHQDYWQWDDATLVAGWLPQSLAYHAGISLAAAALWGMMLRYGWPHDVDEAAAEVDAANGSRRPEAGERRA